MPCADGGHCSRTSKHQDFMAVFLVCHPDRWRQQSIIRRRQQSAILRPIHIFSDPTIDQLISRSINQSEVDCRSVHTMDGIYINSPTNDSICVAWLYVCQSVCQSINQSSNRSINRAVTRSIKRSITRSISQSIDQSINRSTNRSLTRSINP